MDLSETILAFYSQKKRWTSNKKAIVDKCKENYSIEAMAQTFINISQENEK